MNILLNIGIYMLASSLTMVGYVWVRYLIHPQEKYEQMSGISGFANDAHSHEENIAA